MADGTPERRTQEVVSQISESKAHTFQAGLFDSQKGWVGFMEGEHHQERIHITFGIDPDTLKVLERLANPPINTQLAKILTNIQELKHKMSEASDAIAELVTVATDLAADVTSLKASVEAFIAANPGVDVTALKAAIDSLKTADTDVEATIAEVNPTPAP